MRLALIVAALTASASAAFAQPEALNATRPAAPAPAAASAIETRESWCTKYAAWFIAQTPAPTNTPADARPTQRMETELSSCKLDPQQYERETLAELQSAETRAG